VGVGLKQRMKQLPKIMLWARIKVRGDRVEVPREVEMGSDSYIFKLLIWCEIPTTVGKR